MKKHSPILLLSTFFILCCWGQISNGMKLKQMSKMEKNNRKKEAFLFFLIQKKKKKLGIKETSKYVSTKKRHKFTQENNIKPYIPCYDTQFPFDEDLYCIDWTKEKIPMID